MEQETITLTAKQLHEIIGGLYFGFEEDLSSTEDMMEFLETHPDLKVTISV